MVQVMVVEYNEDQVLVKMVVEQDRVEADTHLDPNREKMMMMMVVQVEEHRSFYWILKEN
jgi:hypothetical protein